MFVMASLIDEKGLIVYNQIDLKGTYLMLHTNFKGVLSLLLKENKFKCKRIMTNLKK